MSNLRVVRSPHLAGKQPVRNRTAIVQPTEKLTVKSLESWRYQWHEAILERHDLHRSAIAVAGVLMHRYRGDRGYAEISYRELGKRAGCSTDTATKAIKSLLEKGLIEMVRNQYRAVHTLNKPTNRYRLIYRSRGVGF